MWLEDMHHLDATYLGLTNPPIGAHQDFLCCVRDSAEVIIGSFGNVLGVA